VVVKQRYSEKRITAIRFMMAGRQGSANAEGMAMRQRIILIGATLVLLMSAALFGISGWNPPAPSFDGPVYTVARVQAGLRRQPARWLGKTVLIRATAEGRCGFPGPDGTIGNCALAPRGVPFFGLIDATGWTNGAAVAGSLPLLLDPPAADPPFSRLFRWLRLLPQPRRQTLKGGQAIIYRVRLGTQAPCFTEGLDAPCAVAELQL